MKLSEKITDRNLLIVSVILNFVLLSLVLYQFGKSDDSRPVNDNIRTDMVFSSKYATGDILLIGGERMQVCAWRNLIGDSRICNLSIHENTIADEQRRAGFIFDENEPSQVIVMLGMQDLKQGRPVNEVYGQFVKYIELLRQKLPQTEVVIHSLMPIGPDKYNEYSQIPLENIVNYNTLIKMYALQEGLIYLNMYDEFLEGNGLVPRYNTGDGFHLSQVAYRQWKDRLQSVMPSKEN